MARWNEQDSAGGGAFLLGALAGALVGAGVALLMAPKSGAQTRQELSSSYNSMRDAAARRYRDLADRASAKIEQTVDQYGGRTSSTSTGNTASTSGFPQA